MAEEMTQRYKRSEYLKNGCRECKRRKIKCDEFVNPPKEAFSVINHQGRPLCWNCTRLKKKCEYPKKGERVARVSRKYLMETEKGINSPQQSPTSLSSSSSNYDSRNNTSQAPNVLFHPEDQKLSSSMYMVTGESTSSIYSGVPKTHPTSYQNYNMSQLNFPNTYSSIPKNIYSSLQFTYPITNPSSVGFLQYPQTIPDQPYSASSIGANESHLFQIPEIRDVSHKQMMPTSTNELNPTIMDEQNFSQLPKTDSPSQSLFTNNIPESQINRPHTQSQMSHLLNSGPSILSAEPAQSHSVNDTPLSISASTYEASDLAGLASDLNNLVSDMIFEMNADHKSPNGDVNKKYRELPTGMLENISLNNSFLQDDTRSKIPKNVSLKVVPLLRPRDQQYLEDFYHGFAAFILPFEAYDANLRVNYNPIRDILLTCAAKEPVLLAAILSQSARTAYAKSGSADDEDAYYQYLLKCLKILGPALGQADTKDKDELLSSIEGILLTVLLLTSANAAHSKQNWRPHLKGAKDLLLRKTKQFKRANSKIIVFCKFWFASFEILAGLSLKIGGTLEDPEELNMLLSFDGPCEAQALKEMGLTLENGFNVLSGFHHELIPVLRDLIKILNKTRKDAKLPNGDIFEYLRLLAELERLSGYEFVSNRCFLNSSDFPNGVIPSGLLLDCVLNSVSADVISWMDLSHQVFILASKAIILRDFLGLSYDSPQMQSIASEFARWFSFLALALEYTKQPNLSILMVQWPLQVFGMILIRPNDRQFVEKIYNYAERIGAGSAGHFINRLRRVWQNRDSGLADNIDDSVDLVNY